MLQNLTFSQATSAATVAIYQLLRGGTNGLFYTPHTSLATSFTPHMLADRTKSSSSLKVQCPRFILVTTTFEVLWAIFHYWALSLTFSTLFIGILCSRLPFLEFGELTTIQIKQGQSLKLPQDTALPLQLELLYNASNINTMITALSQQVPSITSHSRLRCTGHVINMVVKVLLYGEGITVFNRIIIRCSDSEAFELWRKFGALGKVHNTVTYIMRSDERQQQFLPLQGDDSEGTENDDFHFQYAKRLLV